MDTKANNYVICPLFITILSVILFFSINSVILYYFYEKLLLLLIHYNVQVYVCTGTYSSL